LIPGLSSGAFKASNLLPMMPVQALVPDQRLILDAARLKGRFAISCADAMT